MKRYQKNIISFLSGLGVFLLIASLVGFLSYKNVMSVTIALAVSMGVADIYDKSATKNDDKLINTD